MDGVTGGAILLMFTTAPSILILVVNCILYALIWQKLRTESKRIQDSIGKEASSAKASHRAVRTMMLFVVMFVIQWTASSVFGVWEYIDDAPPFVVLFTVLLANSGGLLNGFIFIYMYRKRVKTENETTMTTKA
ncbi:Hypothetical predicted protein [Mytilus galloprovincialis]|uniref:G-protein coupled receptors family 1 profile domain-containing protein n=2 Tax=Mytilus TaxID=6548 RepID=A0A8B6BNV2_MYTGA|nr:Hypothetical predicted protein [Mytilus galloprovincialis]